VDLDSRNKLVNARGAAGEHVGPVATACPLVELLDRSQVFQLVEGEGEKLVVVGAAERVHSLELGEDLVSQRMTAREKLLEGRGRLIGRLSGRLLDVGVLSPWSDDQARLQPIDYRGDIGAAEAVDVVLVPVGGDDDVKPAMEGRAVTAVTLAYMLLGYAYGPVFLSLIVALYTAVMEGHRLAAWLGAGALYGGHFGLRYLLDVDDEPTLGQFGFVAAWLLVVLAGSEVARMRRESVVEARLKPGEPEGVLEFHSALGRRRAQ
jgi:hypothetical protein